MAAPTVEEILSELQSSGRPIVESLEAFRHVRFEPLWQADSRLHRAFVKKLIDSNHPSRAFELAREGLQPDYHAGDAPLQYLAALALARSGNVSKAAEWASSLLDERDLDAPLKSDVLSLKGRLEKDLYQRSGDSVFAERSARFYQQAYSVAHDSFPGVNAATMLLLAGHRQAASQLAETIVGHASADLQRPEAEHDYWLLATLGEAHMIRGGMSDARDFYQQAVQLAVSKREEGSIASMRRQVQLVAERMPEAETLLDIFDLGNIVVFAGHLLDHPPWIVQPDYRPRFPPAPELIDAVRAAIDEKLDELDARIGYSGAACGADLLFCQQMLERGRRLHVVLPFDKQDFYRTSVDFGLPEHMAEWRKLCDRVLDEAFEIHYATRDRYLGDEVLFTHGNSFAQGLALIRAERVGLSPVALCVFDPAAPGSIGTLSFLQRNQERGNRVELINLAQIREQTNWTPPDPEFWRQALARRVSEPAGSIRRECRAMLFADVKNYSQVTDQRAPDFFVRYLDEVSDLLEHAQVTTLCRNTWGDGLFLVFADVLDCADTALQLVQRIEGIDWPEFDLPGDTTVRVGVHYGPVYQHFDKIIRKKNFFGSQVNRTARIEPVTTPGCVFASEQFVAGLAVGARHDYVVEYVGVERLDKDFDRCALYRLARRNPPLQATELAGTSE